MFSVQLVQDLKLPKMICQYCSQNRDIVTKAKLEERELIVLAIRFIAIPRKADMWSTYLKGIMKAVGEITPTMENSLSNWTEAISSVFML